MLTEFNSQISGISRSIGFMTIGPTTSRTGKPTLLGVGPLIGHDKPLLDARGEGTMFQFPHARSVVQLKPRGAKVSLFMVIEPTERHSEQWSLVNLGSALDGSPPGPSISWIHDTWHLMKLILELMMF